MKNITRLPTSVKHQLTTKTQSVIRFALKNRFMLMIAILVVGYVSINGVTFDRSNSTLKELNAKHPKTEEANYITSEAMDSVVNEVMEAVKQNNDLIFNRNGDVESVSTQKVAETPRPEKVEIDDNKANNFANVAIVLNPTYFKRHNIDKKVQKELMNNVKSYVSRYVPVAKIEQNLYGIPTSITLAQGLLESDAGHSRLAKTANNHFGIKCFSRACAKGHCKNYTDDSHKDFFRNYKSAWESYRAHSLFLQKPRYKHLLTLPPTDYKAWAKGLREAGYATDKRYADKLITLIEALDLHQYDK
ncbi:MAG: glycoside hydrolase family 73 protein [Saprospiraceae bacterium]